MLCVVKRPENKLKGGVEIGQAKPMVGVLKRATRMPAGIEHSRPARDGVKTVLKPE
jgi:hypothetical protein